VSQAGTLYDLAIVVGDRADLSEHGDQREAVDTAVAAAMAGAVAVVAPRGATAEETAVYVPHEDGAPPVHRLVVGGNPFTDFFNNLGGAIEQAFSGKPGTAPMSGEAGQRTVNRAVDAVRTVDEGADAVMSSEAGQEVMRNVPFGGLITAAHDFRFRAMHGQDSLRVRREREEQARLEREQREREEQARREERERAAAERREAERQAAASAATEARDGELNALLMEAQATIRAARRGEERARRRILALKEAANGGDLDARRRLRVYQLVAEDEQERVNAA
jgi:hypothetical protein